MATFRNKTAYAAASLLATRFPCSIKRVRGYYSGAATNLFLQVHDTTVTPADASIKQTLKVSATSNYDLIFERPLALSEGCTVTFSAGTEGTYTAEANTNRSFHIEFDDQYGDLDDAIEVSDAANNFVDVAGTKRIVAVCVDGHGANPDEFLQLHTVAQASLVSGTTVPAVSRKLEMGQNNTFIFGVDGPLVVSGSTYCLAVSSTEGKYTAVDYATSAYDIYYYYLAS